MTPSDSLNSPTSPENNFEAQIERKAKQILQRDDPPNRRFSDVGVVIRSSSCGRGLFATRFFAKFVPIGRVRGIVVDDAEYSSDYCVDAGGALSLEPGAPFCYLNHSCDPNCAFYRYSGPDEEQEATEPPKTLMNVDSLSIENVENEKKTLSTVVEDCARTICVGCPDAEICDSFSLNDGKIDPNYPLYRDDDVEIWLETLRPIEIGEELTIDYSWGPERAVPCACGSPKCRGWIVDPQRLPEILAKNAALNALKHVSNTK